MIKHWDLREIFIFLSIFLYTGWASFQGFILKFDAAARIPNTLIYISLILVLIFYRSQLKQFTVPLVVWLIWTTYTVVNSSLQNELVVGVWTVPFFAFLLYGKLAYFTVLLVMLQRRRLLTLIVLAWSLMASCLLFCFYGEQLLHRALFERMLSDVVNANEIAFSGVALTTICVYLLLITKPRCIIGLSGIILSVVLVALTASRTAFACLLPMLFIGFWNFWRKRFSLFGSVVINLILLAMITLPAWQYIEEQTVVSQRFQYRTEEVKTLKIQEGWISDILGERAIYYYEGMELWARFPVFGIGYGNYLIYSRTGTRCHIEYMAQLTEGGLVGAFIYAIFLLILLIVPIRYVFSESGKLSFAEKTLSLGALMSILLVNIGLYTAMHNDFYILCACVFTALPGNNDTAALLDVPNNDNGKEETLSCTSA